MKKIRVLHDDLLIHEVLLDEVLPNGHKIKLTKQQLNYIKKEKEAAFNSLKHPIYVQTNEMPKREMTKEEFLSYHLYEKWCIDGMPEFNLEHNSYDLKIKGYN